MHPKSTGALLALAWLAGATPALARSESPPGPAQGDTAPTPTDPGPSANSDSGTDGEILVTARRRAESVTDVPVAISIVGGKEIDATGSFNVNRLQQLQPSLQFFSSNPRNTAVNIRGIGAPFGLTNDGIEQGVGIYVDDVYYARVAASTFDFLDVERIEVLRGPQGTLYGKNTTAGALNITSRQPSFEPEGRVEVSVGNLGYAQGKLAVSGPLGDKVAARFVVSATSRSGTLFNVTSGDKVNELNNLGARAQILWQPSDSVSLTFAGDYNRQDPECCGQVFVSVAPTQRAVNRQYDALAAHFGYAPASRDPFDRVLDNDTALRAKQSFGGLSARLRVKAGEGEFTSVTSWRAWDWNSSNDRDYTSLPITTISASPSHQSQWTQEFRYTSGDSHRLDYLLGLFLFRQQIRSTGLQQQGSAASYWLLGPTNGTNPALLDGLRQTTSVDYRNDSAALFGRLTWKVSSTVQIEPGLRLNYDRKKADYDAVVTGGLQTTSAALIALKNSVLQSQSYKANLSDWNLSGDLTLSWKPSASWLVYARYARSFKSAGVNLSGIPAHVDGTPATEAATVKPEKVNHYELGVKGTFADGRGTLAATVYRTDIRDFQATVVNGAVGVLRGYLANADKVRSQGAELEVALRPTSRLRLNASLAYTDAKYVSFPDAPPPLELSGGSTAVVDISGQPLPGVSKWSASYGAEYAVPARLMQAEGEAFLAVDGNARTRWSSSASPSKYMWVAGSATTNARAGWRGNANGWEAFGWVRNLFNVHTFDFLTAQAGSTGLIVGQPSDPRTFGITASYHY